MTCKTIWICEWCGLEMTSDPSDGFPENWTMGAIDGEDLCKECGEAEKQAHEEAKKQRREAGQEPPLRPVGAHVPEWARCPTCRSPYPNFHPTDGISFVDPKSPATHNPPARICPNRFHNEDK